MPKRARKVKKSWKPSKPKKIRDTSSPDSPYELECCLFDTTHVNQPAVYCAQFNHLYDGYIFAAGFLNRVVIFDAEEEIKQLQSYQMAANEHIFALDWSKNDTDEMVLIAGGQLGIIYDVFGERTLKLTELFGKKAINDIKFSPVDSNLFAVAGEVVTFLCNMQSLCIVCILYPPTLSTDKQITTVSFDPTGTYLASACENSNITIWDIKRNPVIQTSIQLSSSSEPDPAQLPSNVTGSFGFTIDQIHDSTIDSIIWLGSFTILTKGADEKIVLWRMDNDKEELLPINEVCQLFNADAPDSGYWFMRLIVDRFTTKMAVGTAQGRVIVYDLDSDSVEDFDMWNIKSFTIGSSACMRIVRAISFSPDSQVLIYTADDGCIYKYVLKSTDNESNFTSGVSERSYTPSVSENSEIISITSSLSVVIVEHQVRQFADISLISSDSSFENPSKRHRTDDDDSWPIYID